MKLFLDDERAPPVGSNYVVARSSIEAAEKILVHGWPTFMSLDHDLGGNDTTMWFLHLLVAHWDGVAPIPEYVVHSANPVGARNIVSFMESWKKSLTLP